MLLDLAGLRRGAGRDSRPAGDHALLVRRGHPGGGISRSPGALPLYAFYSVVRIAMAYLLSLLFALVYGYIAAYNQRLEGVMVAVLDILQSIPVLSFLPGVMLAMVALFPTRQLGVEFGAILLIFTGQVWNMAFSFYASLKSIPRELREAARDLPLRHVAAVRAAGAAVRRDRPGVELDGVGGRRLVLPDGLRNVRAGQARFPPARPGLLPANGRQRGRHGRHFLGPGRHDRRDRADRSAGLAAGHRVVGQVQIRAGGKQPQAPTSAVLNLLRRSNAAGALPRAVRGRHLSSGSACGWRARPVEREHAARPRRMWKTVAAVRAGALLAIAGILYALWRSALHRCETTRRRRKLVLHAAGAAATFLRVNVVPADRRRLDHSRRRGHRLQPQAGAHRAAVRATCGVRPGHGAVSRSCCWR